MQRTDYAERFLERFVSIPLISENVFRSPNYLDKITDKELVDLLLVLKNEGIFISMKCQQDPQHRTGPSLIRWVRKSAQAALRQVKGGIKTSRNHDFWCIHPRYGRISFSANEIVPIRAIVIVETMEEVILDTNMSLEIGSVPVSYLSVNEFLNLISDLRTIKDLNRYLRARSFLPLELQRTVSIDRSFFLFYVLHNGFPRYVGTDEDMTEELRRNSSEVGRRIVDLMESNRYAQSIEAMVNALAVRLETYKDGLNESLISGYDVDSDRRNYLRIQNEFCDLVLDERRKLGETLESAVVKSGWRVLTIHFIIESLGWIRSRTFSTCFLPARGCPEMRCYRTAILYYWVACRITKRVEVCRHTTWRTVPVMSSLWPIPLRILQSRERKASNHSRVFGCPILQLRVCRITSAAQCNHP